MEFYRQSNQYTGAAAALLMALHHLNPQRWPLDREHEFSIWLKTTNLPTRSSSIYGLATIAQENATPARVIVAEREYDYPDYRFKRYKKVEIDDAKLSSELHARYAKQAGVNIEERDFDLEEVKRQLKEGRLVLLRVNAGVLRERKATSKFVLIASYDGANYIVFDPAQGEIHIEDLQMQEAFQTLVTKKKRDHRMLVLG